MGRPRLKIDPSTVENLAALGCTVPEIAAFVGCSKRTIEMRFCAIIENGRERMKTSIRRMQYESANRGSIAMQIWLGKQYLGQRDKQELTGADGAPLVEKVTVTVVNGTPA